MDTIELRYASAIAEGQGRPLAGYSAKQLTEVSMRLDNRAAAAIATAPVQIRARILERCLRNLGVTPETPRKAAPVVAKPPAKIAPAYKPGRLLRPTI